MNPRAGLLTLRIVLGMVAGGYGLALAVSEFRGSMAYGPMIIGLAEVGAAILFLISRTMRWGGAALIGVFAFAALFHVLHAEYGIGYLAVYSAACFAVISAEGRA